jgi:hypothetical protein
MYHTIEFAADSVLDLATSPKQPLERVQVRRGTRLLAQIKSYVAELEEGPVEMADLYFEDGTTTQGIRWAWFFFVE